jgi:hypothetical protein
VCVAEMAGMLHKVMATNLVVLSGDSYESDIAQIIMRIDPSKSQEMLQYLMRQKK